MMVEEQNFENSCTTGDQLCPFSYIWLGHRHLILDFTQIPLTNGTESLSYVIKVNTTARRSPCPQHSSQLYRRDLDDPHSQQPFSFFFWGSSDGIENAWAGFLLPLNLDHRLDIINKSVLTERRDVFWIPCTRSTSPFMFLEAQTSLRHLKTATIVLCLALLLFKKKISKASLHLCCSWRVCNGKDP